MSLHRQLVVAAGLIFLVLAAHPASAARRVALVIGNDAYSQLEELQKAVADAESYAGMLRAQGFDEVLLRTNRTRAEMDADVAAFVEMIAP